MWEMCVCEEKPHWRGLSSGKMGFLCNTQGWPQDAANTHTHTKASRLWLQHSTPDGFYCLKAHYGPEEIASNA